MSTQLQLTGVGAAYIRVSEDDQDTVRQYAAIEAFQARNEVTIAKHNTYEDINWKRSQADSRPAFQALLGAAEAGRVNWIVVAELDRFGTEDADQLIHYRYRLRKAGCRLYDCKDVEWTAKNIATLITAVVEGHRSEGETRDKSGRIIGGMAAWAKRGDWLGGVPPFALDVACYPLAGATEQECWRVVFEGFQKRLQVFPDGTTKRADGKGGFPAWNDEQECLRLTPTRDKAKLAALRNLFKRYATESIGFTVLAHWLSDLDFRTAGGGRFLEHHIERILSNPAYLGFPVWNKDHGGKFHRLTGGVTVEETNLDEHRTPNAKADWVYGTERRFPQLIDQKTWTTVQEKLANRERRRKAPVSAELYLSGRLFCAGCGGRMFGRAYTQRKRPEYLCSSYHRATRDGKTATSKCLRNGVYQDELEPFILRYLNDVGERLDVLTEGLDADDLTGRLRGQETGAWIDYQLSLSRLTKYLYEHHHDQYEDIVLDAADRYGERMRNGTLGRFEAPTREERDKHEAPGGEGRRFVEDCLAAYRANFDPAAVAADITRAEQELRELMEEWRDLPKLSIVQEEAKARMTALNARIEELRAQSENVAEVVERYYREMLDLRAAIAQAKAAMESTASERALRQRAERIGQVIHRIECRFKPTGKTGSGTRQSRLEEIVIYPVLGDAVHLSAAQGNTSAARSSG
jgi:DNA invertase Pin-like site-specific DNA recombinase